MEGGEQNSKYLAFWISSIKYFKVHIQSDYLASTTLYCIQTNYQKKNMFLENLHFIICYFSIFTRDSNIFENEKLRKKVGVQL